MARVLVLEKARESRRERRPRRIQEVLGSLGHSVIEVDTPADVIPRLGAVDAPFDAVVLWMLRPDGNPDSFDVINELCRDPALRKLAKIMVFPRQADPREEAQMYGVQGMVSLEPHWYRTVIVSESRLEALREALLSFQLGS